MFPDTTCHLCGSDSYQVRYQEPPAASAKATPTTYKITDHGIAPDVQIVTCRKCGLSFLSPRPSDQDLRHQYAAMVDEPYLAEEDGRRAAARRTLKHINKLKPEKGRLLDLGCATGLLLDEARRMGWDVYGVEISEWAVDYAKHQLDLRHVYQGTLREAGFARNFFDAIILTDVIEHLPSPKTTLEDIRPLLKPSGIFCCNTPDIDSWASRLLKAKWWGIKQAHLYYFNKHTLHEILHAAGFAKTKMRSHGRTFTLGYWLANFTKYRPAFKRLDRFVQRHRFLARMLITLDLGDQIEVFARRRREIKYLKELEAPALEKTEKKNKKTVVVLPAFNAAKTLPKTLQDIPQDCVDDILLVDDASQDDTVAVAKRLGLKVFPLQANTGYGGNQKMCYKQALELGADIVVMVHPDYQYDPTAIPALIEPILKGRADAVFGSRMMKGGALEGGMPGWKYNANILLTALENVVLGIYLTEYHTGFRAYSRKYLSNINFEANSNGFVFDTEIIVQGVLKYMKFEEVPIRTRYFDEASSIKLWPCIIYGLSILKTLGKFLLHKNGWTLSQFE